MADPSKPAGVLQIAPNDHPPFGDILTAYRQALESLNVEAQTVVLSPPRGEPVAGCTYLGLEDLADVRTAARSLRRAIGTLPGQPRLAVCHRYRAEPYVLEWLNRGG